jgi:hypothetical protein
LGISDDQQQLCFALALWNEAEPILKERLFGLTNSEGNHGEDVKEYYFFLDNTPTHSYMKALYKYPQRAFPYNDLVATNRNRSRQEPEYELIDTGVFAEDRYFDVSVEYAKADPLDVLMRVRGDLHHSVVVNSDSQQAAFCTVYQKGPACAVRRCRLQPAPGNHNLLITESLPPSSSQPSLILPH